jgi:iron(III) transport system substrate-binding protein
MRRASSTSGLSRSRRNSSTSTGGLRSAHALVKEPPDRTPLSAIKLMREDAAEVDRMAEEIKAKYTQIFRV